MLLNESYKTGHGLKKTEESKEIFKDRDKLIAIKQEKIRREFVEIENKLKGLQSRRGELYRAKLLKEEYGGVVKQSFSSVRSRILDRFKGHVKESRENGTIPFDFKNTQFLFKDWEIHLIMFLALTDKDVDEIIESLPEGGMSSAERDAELEVIEKSIEDLKSSLKSEIEAETESN